MPFCEECARYFAPSAMRSDGSCPQCGRVLDAPSYTAKNLDLRELADARAPWHF